MFKNQDRRSITKGVDASVPKELQVVCWQLVDDVVKKKRLSRLSTGF